MDTEDKTIENKNACKTYTTWKQFLLIRILAVVIPNICGLAIVLPTLLSNFSASSNEMMSWFEFIILRLGSIIFLLGFILGAPIYTLQIIDNKNASITAHAVSALSVKYIPINIQGFKTVVKKNGVGGALIYFALWAFVGFFGFIFVAIDIIKRLRGKYYEFPPEPGLTEEELNDPEAKKFRKKADIMLIVCIVFCIMLVIFSNLLNNADLLIAGGFPIVFFMYCFKWLPKAVKYKKAFVVTFSLILFFVTGVVCL